jgi:hypothetical protein
MQRFSSRYKEKILTAERLRRLLKYDSECGIWIWLVRRPHRPVGSIAGSINKNNYRDISIDSIDYRSSRLAWLYMTGSWPDRDVDHRDTNPSNDKWSNLRLATQTQNNANTRRYKNNRSGFKGVGWHRGRERWMARIQIDGRSKHLGYFDDPNVAYSVYIAAAFKIFGEFARVI